MNDFEGFENLVQEVTTNFVEIARELALTVEPENVGSPNVANSNLLLI